ncbi:SPOR domain-containing protein [Alterisphingorhabdus coralli]|uniref:SPOR domain-containing protein n=1 Tax=Alterisphingorhabdus coralli TaxID=3071408 RepID=A0AA97F6R7_9SPHN|nr:SPOR domain-containing protein [Parasphingorhabdus sp. SCSIO 66989]WOE74302.1 SPOR domain-containing protein [Parasphingorhabdus sp. SCSIO 66989]
MTTSSPALADVKTGVEAWEKGDFSTAVNEWRQPALDGDPDAQFNLGQAYKLGRGVPMDLTVAADWFRKAAEQNHIKAADNYGLILFQNNQRQEAIPWLQQSAKRGEPRAQYLMGTAHFNGNLVEKDWVRAYALMTRASSSGLPQASKNLSAMDQYLSLEQRQQGITLAGQLEQEATRERQRQLAAATLPPDSNPPATPAPIRTPPAAPRAIPSTQLPPSTVAMPAPQKVAATVDPTTIDPRTAGADFAGGSTAAPMTQAVAAAPVTSARSAPPTARTGNWRVQLGAFSTQAKAQALWNNLERRNTALTSLQPYLVNAGNVTRLQVGPFASRNDANRLCNSLKANGQDCFSVRK